MLRARYSFLSSSEVLEAEVENLQSDAEIKPDTNLREVRLRRSSMVLMQNVTVKKLKTMIEKEHHLPPGSIDIVSELYGITHENDEKLDTTNVLQVVRHPNARIIPTHLSTTVPDSTYPGETEPRALLSCGHAMAADTLYQNITVQLKSGKSVLKCFSCKKEWDFQDTSEKAQMSLDEKLFWGMKVSLNSVGDECPKCGYYCQRIAGNNDRAVCMKCSKEGVLYEFCWKCKLPWKDNHKCLSKEAIQSMINNCETKTMPYSNIKDVPSIRVCPSCGAVIQHLDMCKEMRCYHCKKSFCFVCLTMCERGLKCSSFNAKCFVAPRQIV